MRNRKGVPAMLLGLALLAGAACLTVWNRAEEVRAAAAAQATATVLLEQVLPDKTAQATPQEQTAVIPQTVSVEQEEYLGVLEIPALELTLPVLAEWSYPGLRQAPCRYAGSALTGDLIIAGHNYRRHFGGLAQLQPGDAVRFTDATGVVYEYQVSETELLRSTDVEEMAAGEWDLTLFTCTLGGQNRVTVRCESAACS